MFRQYFNMTGVLKARLAMQAATIIRHSSDVQTNSLCSVLTEQIAFVEVFLYSSTHVDSSLTKNCGDILQIMNGEIFLVNLENA